MKDNFVALEIQVSGSGWHISADVMFRQLAKALQGFEFQSGTSYLYQDSIGRIYINQELVYVPKGVSEVQQDIPF